MASSESYLKNNNKKSSTMYKIQNENSAIKTKRVNLILVSDRISQEEKTK